MHTPAIIKASRLLPIFGIILLMSLTSGCATRALMSSERYEKAEPSQQQLHSSNMQPQDLEQAYQLALQQQGVAIK